MSKFYEFNAKNNLASGDIFEERKKYALHGLEKDDPKLRVKDLINNDFFYGKVNNTGDSIFVSETNLKQIPSTSQKTIFAIDFIVDAYEEFREYFNKAIITKRIKSRENIINTVEVKRAWESSGIFYHNLMETLYEQYSLFLKSNFYDKKIQNFSDFVDFFLLYIKKNQNVFTNSAFIKSKFCPYSCTGLFLELSFINAEFSDDAKKGKIIEDVNFPFYRNALRKFGFSIDKNAPHRIIANLDSSVMMMYASKYGVLRNKSSYKDFFDSYYYKAYLRDIEFLKKYLTEFYINYVSINPYLKIITTNASGKTRSEIVYREKEFNKNEQYWIGLYFSIRLIEEGIPIDEFRKKMILKDVLNVLSASTFDTCLAFVNKTIFSLKKEFCR